MRALAIAFLCLLALPASAAATDRYVSRGGSDANPCTESQPCASFDRAYRVADPGDVVEVSGGSEYPEQTIEVDATKTSAADVVFRATDDAVQTYWLVVHGSHITFEGFTTRGTHAHADADDVTYRDMRIGNFYVRSASNITFEDSEIAPLTTPADGIMNWVTEAYQSSEPAENITFDGVYIHDYVKIQPGEHIDCIGVGNVDGMIVRNSRFRTCEHFALIFGKDSSGAAPQDILLENNFINCCVSGFHAVFLADVDGATVRHNSFNEAGIAFDYGGTGRAYDVVIDSNVMPWVNELVCTDYWATWRYNVIADGSDCNHLPHNEGNQLAPTGFIDSQGFDLHLAAGAAAIDAGNPDSPVTTDIDGDTRPAGDEPDAGADELTDAQAPSVAITAPANGATIWDSTTVSASASDDVGVTGVQFKLDGQPLGAEDTSAPFATAWDTTTASNGSHTLTAVARDAVGRQTTASAVTVTVSNLPSSVVAAYGFGEGSGTTVVDRSASANTGTISGATRTSSGKFGSALVFDGVDDWVTVPDAASLDLTDGMTLEAWVKPTEAGTMWRTVLIKENASHLSYALYSKRGIDLPSVHAFTDVEHEIIGTAGLPLDAWTHLAATYDGERLKLYVNGDLADWWWADGDIVTTSGPLRIGGNAVWPEWFEGTIDEVRIHDVALSEAQIESEMALPLGG